MRIYSYFGGVPEINPEGELRLITLWRKHHEALGFEPVILNEFIARKHPYFEEYDKAIRALPNINPDGYERACFYRWLALAQVGGGLLCDYDLFWIKPPAKDAPIHAPGRIRSYEAQVPSCVAGDVEDIENLCIRFANGDIGERNVNGKKHVSDMYSLEDLITANTSWIESFHVVKHYGTDGWQSAPIVHFAHVTMNGLGPRWKVIPSLLKQHQ